MPRLIRGQLATGIAAKAAKTRESVIARIELARKIKAGDVHRTPDIVGRFRTLGMLAAWSFPESQIYPVSEKTLRRYLNELLAEGFQELQVMIVNQADASTEKEVFGLSASGESQKAVDAVLEMTTRYLDLLERLERIRGDNQEVDALIRQHSRLFGRSPSKTPTPERPILSIV